MDEPGCVLDLTLDPADVPRLSRVPALAALRAGRARATSVEMIWHDTPEGALAAAGLSLCERRVGRERLWRLERLRGTPEFPWPPGAPAPLVAEAAALADLGAELPTPLLPVAALSGQLRTLPLTAPGPLGLALLAGTLRAVTGERAVCRVILSGAPDQVGPLLLALGAAVSLSVPAGSLAAEAGAVAGRVPPPRALGAPVLPVQATVADAFARVAGHLVGVVLHLAPLARADGPSEAVHQIRVALRRLRSAISLFRRAVGGPALDAANADLRALSRVLGPARDWDVFRDGTARDVQAAFPDERAIARLLTAAERRRLAAYAALRTYLDGPAFRLLGLRLALLLAARPWDQPAETEAEADTAKRAEAQATPLAAFAAHMLHRRLARVLGAGDDFAALPTEAVHAVRIQGKRLRYAAEFFAPLFPRKETRRFLRRSSALQERLGHLNDGAAVAGLLAQLGDGGAERALAVGIVRGFVAAGMRAARAKSERSWRKFSRLEPFWE